jgi:hypothetical protein
MPGFFDRLGRAAQQTAAAAQQAAAEAKVQLDIRQVNGRFDEKAAELGKLVYRQQQGEEVADLELAALIKDLREIDTERAQKEAELQAMRSPAPAPAPPAPTPVVPPAPPPAVDPEPAPVSAPVEEEVAEESEPSSEPVVAAGRLCECGTVIPDGAKFCPNCGRPAVA